MCPPNGQCYSYVPLHLNMYQNLHICRCKHLLRRCLYPRTPLLIYSAICWIFHASLHLILSKQMKSWWRLESPQATPSLPSAALILNYSHAHLSYLGVIGYIKRSTVYVPQSCPTPYDHYTTLWKVSYMMAEKPQLSAVQSCFWVAAMGYSWKTIFWDNSCR